MIRRIASALAYTLLAAAVAISLSVTFTVGIGWVVVAAIVVTVVGILIREWRTVSRELQAFLKAEEDRAEEVRLQQQVNRYHCAAHGCSWHLAEDDRVYVCGVCGARVVRDTGLYDQEASA